MLRDGSFWPNRNNWERAAKQALTDRKIPKDELPQYLQDGDSDSDN